MTTRAFERLWIIRTLQKILPNIAPDQIFFAGRYHQEYLHKPKNRRVLTDEAAELAEHDALNALGLPAVHALRRSHQPDHSL